MKKFLALVLALVMTMSLVTVSAGAKDFNDDADINYEEAVAVMSEIGIVDGDKAGNFNPTNGLTRGAAAKIICNLILGPTTAAELNADTNPFPDVDKDSTYAGYIAYCAKEGIVGGYADGTFKQANPLTGYAFMKMLLGALGYEAEAEGYTGANWSINVAKQALGIGLNAGLKDEFNGSDFVTREEAMLYAYNTLQATMVEYDTKTSISIGGADVVIAGAVAQDVSWGTARLNDGNIADDGFVQFAEKYFSKLVKLPTVNAFGAPAYTWTWKSEEIGTYVDYTTLVAEYTDEVEYQELYADIGKLAADEYYMNDYLDGNDNTVNQNAITKKNDAAVPGTGNGVLTQVFLNNDTEEFSVVSMNTYVAQAVSDYSEKADQLTLKIYTGLNNASIIRTISGEDFAIAGYEKDDVILVNMAGAKQTVEIIADPEVVAETAITTYTVAKDIADNGGQYKLSSVVADGEKYSTAVKAFWDAAYLYNYYEDVEQLKDHKYNLYLDAYGYVVGVENVADTTNYVFVVGYDVGSSVLAKTLDKALVIFPDGTMETITCYEKDKNVQVAAADNANVNEWWTYTQDEDGTYALKAQVATQFHDLDTNRVLDVENPTLKGVKINSTFAATGDEVAYGNAKSVYITVEADDSVVRGGSIVDVTAVSEGIKGTSIDMSEKTTQNAYGAYVLYDGNYVKYAVVVGEDGSVADRFVYLTTGIGERSWDATPGYYWSYDAIVEGQLIETENGKGGFDSLTEVDTQNAWLAAATLYEASYDKDGYAKKMVALTDNWQAAETTTNKDAGYVQYTGNDIDITLRGQTMYFETANWSDRYVMTDDNCVFFVQNTDTTTGTDYVLYSDIDAAMAATGAMNGEKFKVTGKVVAICDATTGFATTVIITDSVFENKNTTVGGNTGSNTVSVDYVKVDLVQDQIVLDKNDAPAAGRAWTAAEKAAVEAAAKEALVSVGYKATTGVTFGAGAGDVITAVNMAASTPQTFQFTIVWG